MKISRGGIEVISAAAKALGVWAGEYVSSHFDQQANVLDLTYRLSNMEARSQGFMAGLREVVPSAQTVLSMNAQSRSETAFQLTADALTVYPNINVIFAINDSTAWGAIREGAAAGINSDTVAVLAFGLEGNTLKDALMDGTAGYCKAGLTMFPEIVAPVCIEAEIGVHSRQPLDKHLDTPFAILTRKALLRYYSKTETGWVPNWETIRSELAFPLETDGGRGRRDSLPRRIGLVIPFSEHECHKKLTALMRELAKGLGIEFEAVDAAQTIKDDVMLSKRAIAQTAKDIIS